MTITRRLLFVFLLLTAPTALLGQNERVIRVGIIGLDTSHAPAFVKMLNDPKAPADLAGCRVVAAYPHGSKTIESSYSRIPKYTEAVKKHGVEIVDSIDALLQKVDAVCLETNDGKPHLEQALQVIRARKPLFVDKPVAASLADAVAIYREAERLEVPIFSSSSLRFAKSTLVARAGAHGEIVGAETFSPASTEPSHPDLFWYGIHGVESLFTVMGPGCRSVRRVHTPDTDLVIGIWEGDRIGTFRGQRSGKRGYGGTAYGTKKVAPVGDFDGYRPLLVAVVALFRTGKPPVSARETLEIYAFMAAADASKKRDGAAVSIESVMKQAEAEATARLKQWAAR